MGLGRIPLGRLRLGRCSSGLGRRDALGEEEGHDRKQREDGEGGAKAVDARVLVGDHGGFA